MCLVAQNVVYLGECSTCECDKNVYSTIVWMKSSVDVYSIWLINVFAFNYVLTYLFFKNFYFYFILLYNTVLVLPYIDMNPSRVYMRSQT